ncbi:TrgA family protein [Actibacterium sp.]|uniref:TrgA family protein n=1 Tax=Actibacterium sp. TaxID=1872125 RepID=UPI00356A5DBC
MPTAPRLVAFVAFALVAYVATGYYIPELPEGTKTRYFAEMNAAIGGIVGWRVMGTMVGQGYGRALTIGFRTICTLVFYALLVHGVIQMIKGAMKHYYEGPGDAVIGLGELILNYGQLVVTSVPVLTVLAVGGAISALITEWTSARWN